MYNNNFFRKSLTTLAVVAAIGVSAPSFAGNTDGGLRIQVVDSAKSPVAGAKITVRNKATGATRTLMSDSGSVRLSNLPVGEYEVLVEKSGFEVSKVGEVRVRIGDDTGLTVGLQMGGVERMAVTGQAVRPIDVTSSETSLNISAVELSRIPVPRDVTSVALLAPGVTKGDSRFGNVASFGGASAAENTMYINGLNVTNFRNGLGFSTVPYEFYKEFQVKTGGYSAEFGRSTGGVINAVTKSGSNDFEAGASVYWKPESLRSNAPNVYEPSGKLFRYNSETKVDSKEYNVYVSGAAVEDKLFYFLMYNPRDIQQKYNGSTGETYSESSQDNAFWGGKIDWNIVDGHSLSLFGFSDKNDVVADNYAYNSATKTIGAYSATATDKEGGDNWALTYTGQLTEDFSVRILHGQNQYSLTTLTNVQEDCALVIDYRVGRTNPQQPGCTTTAAYRYETGEDKRKATRIDFDWAFDEHVLRFGMDRETNTSTSVQGYSGPTGQYFQVYDTTPGAKLANGAAVPAGVTSYVRSRFRTVSGTFETTANAYYVEDTWTLNDNITLTLGLRNEAFENKNGEGNTFVKMSNMWAPRLGIAYDPTGDGESKFYANIGRYHLPVANNTNVRLAGNELDYYSYNVFDGYQSGTFNGNTYLTPILGAAIGDRRYNADGSVPDVSGIVDQELDAMYQDEVMLGYQSTLNDNWSWGVRAVQRKLNGAIDDMIIDHWLAGKYGCEDAGQYVLGNPGKDMTVAVDTDCDHEVDQTVTIPGAELLYPEAKRTYYAATFNLERSWDENWMMSFSYTWSHSYGNSEGLVKSDNAQTDAGLTTDFDFPELMDGAYGNLPNDRRHAFKVYGAYGLTENLRVGANLRLESGRPTNAFGIGHPDGIPGYGATYYVCKANCDLIDDGGADMVKFSRGTYGATPWTAQLDLSATYTQTFGETDVEFRVDIFNVLDASGVLRVDETAEISEPGQASPTFNLPAAFQTPRVVQFGASVKF